MPQRPDGALQHRGIGDVEVVAIGLQEKPSLLGLLDAGGCQIHVGPAGEAVLEIPGGFAVADEDELVHGGLRAVKGRRANSMTYAPSTRCDEEGLSQVLLVRFR